MFQAHPSANVSLGEKLELRCIANDTSDLNSMQILSRMQRNLNTTCFVLSNSGVCIFLINRVQLWHIGKYDCMKIYKNGRCFTKTLIIQEAIQIPVLNRTVVTKSTSSTPKTTMEPEQSTTNSLKTQDTTSKAREEATSETIKNVTNDEGN